MAYVKATNRHKSDDGTKRAPGDVFQVSVAEAKRRAGDGQLVRVTVTPQRRGSASGTGAAPALGASEESPAAASSESGAAAPRPASGGKSAKSKPAAPDGDAAA